MIAALALAAALSDPPAQPNPWIAARLGPAATAICLVLPGYGVSLPFFIPGSPFSALPTLAPACLGLGQAYLGNYPKAAAITVGAPVAIMGSALAAQAVYDVLNPCRFDCAGFSNGTAFGVTWLGVGLAVGTWASWDAWTAATSAPAGAASAPGAGARPRQD